MTSDRPEPVARIRLPNLLLLILLSFSGLPAASAVQQLDLPPKGAEAEAWLVTIAPGEIYWQRFGHNAIWLRDPGLGLDHTFNFGYFDFAQENFLLRFLAGRMLYQSLAFSAHEELAAYAAEGRAVTAQRLNLTEAEYARLRDHLLWHVQPANRDYRYDYYHDNCSTRIRDAIDLALDGALRQATGGRPAEANFRAHTQSLTRMTFWYSLGLQAVLGRPVDREVTRWDEMFLPAVVADTVGAMTATGQSAPLASEAITIYPGSGPAQNVAAFPAWPRYALAAAAVLALAWVAFRRRPRARQFLARGWITLASVLGLLIIVLWTLTDHHAVGPNANLLLLNPLFLLLLGRPRLLLTLVVAGGVMVWLQWWLAAWQYNLDVVAMVLPLNLAAAWALNLARLRAEGSPGPVP